MNGKSVWREEDAETSLSHPPKRQKTFHHDSSPTTRHDHYTIAWICALHIEMEAARAMLDEVHEALPRHADDSNTYILGSIKQHNIVIACLPADQYGMNNAANVMTNMKRTFSAIRVGLMVGIGGGVPSKADVRLGDFVIGTRVMQYDLGKVIGDGQFQRIAIPRIPHHLLGTAVSALGSKHELAPSRVPSILRLKLEEYAEYGRPSSPDRLFHATYDHQSPPASCDGCDQSKLVPRSRRKSNDIMIHYGAIASGNQVMRSGTTRDNIARQLDVICFEMEAAGLMHILPCLPIRRICDYSDSHKSKEWQRYAAATAAAYARELLEELPVAEADARVTCMPNPHKGFPELIRTRLKKDPHIHISGERYGYPLFAALANGDKDTVTAVLNSPSSASNGVDITEGLNYRKDLKQYVNRTPLSWAAQEGRISIVKLLLQTETKVDNVDLRGRRPLSRASENGHEAVAELLIGKGADVNARDNDGQTPLLRALDNGHAVVAKLLIDKGADVNARDKDGWTPLSWASAYGHEVVAKLLIDKGANE